MTKTKLLVPALAMALALGGCAKADDGNATNGAATTATADGTVPLVVTSGGKTHRFDVEVALTPKEQEKGLMFRKDMAPDRGMVFPMDPPRTASFWMKNTIIPLDLIFVRTDGSIAMVAAEAKPYDLTPLSAGVPVSGVLELAGGRAAQLGIKAGDKVKWGACAVPDGASNESWNRTQFCP